MSKKKEETGEPTIFQRLTPTKDFRLPEVPKQEEKSFYSYKPYDKMSVENKFALAMLVTLLLAMPIGLGLTIQPKIPLLSKASRDQKTVQENNIPSITTSALLSGQLEENYHATVNGFDIDITNQLTLKATNLPEGLKVQSCKESTKLLNTSEDKVRRIDCTIAGTPTEPGVFRVVISLNDGKDTITKTIPLTITR